jgi:biotin carboxyl carrier protein
MTDGAARTRAADGRVDSRIVDPRAVRVGLASAAGDAAAEAIVIEPAAVPLAPGPHVAGAGMLGGVSAETLAGFAATSLEPTGFALVDGVPIEIGLDRLDEVHCTLTETIGDELKRTAVQLLPIDMPAGRSSGVVRRELVVDGWRIEVEIESERRASLLERARRGREATAHGGPVQVRAIIPGRIVSISVVAGDPVEAGQQLLVVEAMKMQNELRAPRDGIVSSVAVGVGGTIEVGDPLLVLE